MPSSPLIDFDALDLSREVVPIEGVRQVCQQRGRMEILQGVLHSDLEGRLMVGYRDLTPDDWWAADHVPGRPIFPGVLMIEGAAQLCTYDYIRRSEDLTGSFVGYGGVDRVRFRGVVQPPARILWACRLQRLRERMFTYATQAFVDRKLVYEGEILGVVV